MLNQMVRPKPKPVRTIKGKPRKQNFSADEMQYHFDPPTKPDDWDVMTERVQAMKTKEFWKVKHPQNAKRIIEHVNQIEAILQEDRE